MFRKVFCLLLSVCMLMSFCLPAFAVSYKNEEVSTTSTVEDILNEYQAKVMADALSTESSARSYSSGGNNTYKQEAIAQLKSAGYEAYDVNPSTYSALEQTLQTDFDAINLDPDGSYLIVISGEENQSGTRSDDDGDVIDENSFTYTYGGVTYTMRYLIVTADSDPLYKKDTSVDLLKSKVQTVIENCLNTAINLVVSEVSTFLGIVSSICGLSIFDIDTSETATLTFYAGTAWTRIYTQVWDDYMEGWVNGSRVECATCTTSMGGQYYSATLNQYVAVPVDQVVTVKRSAEFFDYRWRKEMAVYGATRYDTVCDLTGAVKYKYGNQVIITHHENF